MADKELKSITFPGLSDRYVIPHPGGNAVVFGDSLFEYAPHNYNFAEYLRSQNMYDTVTDFAEAGSGWDKTWEGTTSLQEKLERSDVQEAVAAADAIYINLSANDVMVVGIDYTGDPIPGTEVVMTPRDYSEDMYSVVEDCLATIYDLNPAAVIYWTPFADIKSLALAIDKYQLAWKRANYKTSVMRLFQIYAAISRCENSVRINSANDFDFIDHGLAIDGDVHPSEDAILDLFTAAARGAYHNKSLRCVPTFFNSAEQRDTTYDQLILSVIGDGTSLYDSVSLDGGVCLITDYTVMLGVAETRWVSVSPGILISAGIAVNETGSAPTLVVSNTTIMPTSVVVSAYIMPLS